MFKLGGEEKMARIRGVVIVVDGPIRIHVPHLKAGMLFLEQEHASV